MGSGGVVDAVGGLGYRVNVHGCVGGGVPVMAGDWSGDWVQTEGTDGDPMEVSADGTHVRVDGVVYPVVDAAVVQAPVDAWGQPRPGGWS